MADRINKVSYCYLTVPSRAGNGAKVLNEIKDAGIDLLAFSGFPAGKGKAQLDLVSKKITPIRTLARRNGWHVSKVKKGFLVQGDTKTGAVHRHIQKLADERINIVAADAVTAGKGRYGMILWVRPKDYRRASRVLHAR
jgi:hypothetical protein